MNVSGKKFVNSFEKEFILYSLNDLIILNNFFTKGAAAALGGWRVIAFWWPAVPTARINILPTQLMSPGSCQACIDSIETWDPLCYSSEHNALL